MPASSERTLLPEENFRIITIEGTNDDDVAFALVTLAQFPKGSLGRRIRTSVWDERANNRESMRVWHRDTLGGRGDEHLMLPPDITVTNVIERNSQTLNFEPTNKYLIEINPQHVDPSLLDKIETHIKEG